jgi:hypothetical protein
MTVLHRETHDKLTIEPSLDGAKLALALSGTSDSFAVQALGAYLDQVTLEVRRLSLSQVDIDVTRVTLLSSSSLKQLITFLRPIKLGELACSVEFVVDDDKPWQRRCLAALVRMCPNGASLRGINAGAAGPLGGSLPYVVSKPPPA